MSWLAKTSIPRARYLAGYFTIGNYGYVAGGLNGTGTGPDIQGFYSDCWRYDPTNNSWSPMANIFNVGNPTYGTLAYSKGVTVNGIGYLIGGQAPGQLTGSACYKYDPGANQWTVDTEPPIGLTYHAGASVGTNGFAGTGTTGNTYPAGTDAWYKFTGSPLVWIEMASVPKIPAASTNGRFHAGSFAIGDKVYIVGGQSKVNAPIFYSNQTLAYDTVNNTWAEKAVIPYAVADSLCRTSWASETKGYVLSSQNELFEYDPISDEWELLDHYTGSAFYGVGFNLSRVNYIGDGIGGTELTTPFYVSTLRPIFFPDDYPVTQITSADFLDHDVDNPPHNDLSAIKDVLNNHHNIDLFHEAEFRVTGNFAVSGASTIINDIELRIADNNLVINEGQASKSGAGLLMTSTNAGDVALFAISGDTWHAGSAPLSATHMIATYNADRTLTLPVTGTGDSAVSLDTALSVMNISNSNTVAITETSQSLFVSGGFSSDVVLSQENMLDDILIKNVWQTSSAMLEGRVFHAGAGTQNNALSFGGQSSSGSAWSTRKDTTYRFNGDTWSALGLLTTSHTEHGGCGVVNAALCFMGISADSVGETSSTEKFDGWTWSNVSSPGGTARFAVGGCGIQNAALCAGGATTSAYVPSSVAERFNGATWVASSSLATATKYNATIGKQNAAVNIAATQCEIYNGSMNTWYIGPNPSLSYTYANGAGVQNNLTVWQSPSSYTMEKFNGSVWSTVYSSIGTDYYRGASAGSANAAVHAGGGNTVTSNSYRWHGEIKLKSTIWIDKDKENIENSNRVLIDAGAEDRTYGFTALIQHLPELNQGQSLSEQADLGELNADSDFGNFAWVAGSDILMGRSLHGGCGTPNNSMIYGGSASAGTISTTEKYNGVTWSAGNSMSSARTNFAAWGNPRASMAVAGSGVTTSSEIYNGLNWSASTSFSTSGYSHAGCGKSTAGLVGGGYMNGALTNVFYLWNGSTFTSTGASNLNRDYFGICGNTKAALVMGAYLAGTGTITTEIFNGATFKYMGNLSASGTSRRAKGSAHGTINDALYAGGTIVSTGTTISERFNGSYWQVTASQTVSRYSHSGNGSGNDASIQGGGGNLASTERYRWNQTFPGTIANIMVTGA